MQKSNKSELDEMLEKYLSDEDMSTQDAPNTAKAKYAILADKLPQKETVDVIKNTKNKTRRIFGKPAFGAAGYNASVTSSNKKIAIASSISIVVAIIIALSIILPIILNAGNVPAYRYTDDKLNSEQTTIEYILQKYNVLLPPSEFFIDEKFNSYDVAVSTIDGKEVFLSLNFFSLIHFDDLQMAIILVDNYDYTYKDTFEILSKSASTDKFEYSHEIYSNNLSKAYFTYGGYEYYVTLSSSDAPERITTILESLA